MRFSLLVEKNRNSYFAHSPDMPGYGATGNTPMEAIEKLQKILEKYMADLKKDLPDSSGND